MKLRTQLQDAWYLFVVPALAALLPWRLAWRGLRWIARHGGGPFAEGAQAAAVIAPEYLPIGDRQAFAAEARAIHEGRSEERGIYGEASPQEVKALVEDGVPVAPLPPAPPKKTEVN